MREWQKRRATTDMRRAFKSGKNWRDDFDGLGFGRI